MATPGSEDGLLELAAALTACQLERALRAFRRVTSADAGESHKLEYVDYHWEEDGSLVLRARLPAEDGTVLVRALDAARDRLRERQRAERSRQAAVAGPEPPRSPQVEALLDVARASFAGGDATRSERTRLVVHIDAAALIADGRGRRELEDGPVISAETARRLGCDADSVTSIDRNGLPLRVGRSRRTVPRTLRRLLEARDAGCCRWPGCENRRHLDAHHRRHWAQGGETRLDNLLLLCFRHHRLVHEGGYTIEERPSGALRFRNRHGILVPSVPRSPPGSADALVQQNETAGLAIGRETNRNGHGDRLDLDLVVAAIESFAG